MSRFLRVVRLLSELPGQIAQIAFPINLPSRSGVFLLSKDRLPSNRELLRVIMHAGQSWWGLKRIVQPRPQIAIEEQLLPQQSGQCR